MSANDSQGLWPAPAKLNLMLRVVGRRADGYHELQTVFQFLDLTDQLHFIPTDDGSIVLHTPLPGVAPEHDLTVRAAHLLQQTSQCRLGAEIHIDKRLPMGGGLGGGSSDAATTLVALNQLWNINLSQQELAQLGLSLGADVPIFIHGHAAWAEGIGETLSDMELNCPWYLIVHPGCHVSTAEVFSAADLTRNSPHIKIADFLGGDRANDCLPVVTKHHPQVADALAWLGEITTARMTGTGACIYGEFNSQAEAESACSRLPERFQGFVARGLNRSPLFDRIDSS
jgi:4-diphosphocytidyl-2-C-methyl-D-erythritol kinase